MAEASRPVPCRLGEGIALEDSGLLLRWGTPVADLIAFQSPEVCRRRGKRVDGGWARPAPAVHAGRPCLARLVSFVSFDRGVSPQ